MANVTVKLTAYNMGDNADEPAFDAWIQYVAEHIEAACKFPVDVEAFRFSDGPADDLVTIGRAAWEVRDEQTQTVHEAIEALWGNWCAEGAPGVTASGT